MLEFRLGLLIFLCNELFTNNQNLLLTKGCSNVVWIFGFGLSYSLPKSAQNLFSFLTEFLFLFWFT